MGDINSLVGLISGIKAATEIAKALKQIDSSFEQVDLKLKMVELMDALVDAKMNAFEVQELIGEKDDRVRELEEALKFTEKIGRFGELYFEVDEGEKPMKDPYCPNCWEVDRVAVHTHTNIMHQALQDCPKCKNCFRMPRRPY